MPLRFQALRLKPYHRGLLRFLHSQLLPLAGLTTKTLPRLTPHDATKVLSSKVVDERMKQVAYS